MNKNIYALLALFMLLAHIGAAQYNLPQNKVWAMGKNVGLDFRSGTPVVINTHFDALIGISNEGAASLADSAGLVFYSNGETIWNKLGNVMPHGTLINGTGNNTQSTSQGALIVPMGIPDQPYTYYLFSLTSYDKSGKLFCNKVDLSLDNGNGDIDTSFSLYKMPLDSLLAEKMIAVPGCNGNIWIVVHSMTQPIFKAYELTPAGLNLTPVISAIGNWAFYHIGVMKVNPQYNKIMMCTGNEGLELYNFNNSTGVVSNRYLLDSTAAMGYYGGCFSPDGTKVYGKEWYGPTITTYSTSDINQFDLNAANPAASKFLLGTANATLADMQLGPDGKIYFASRIGFSNSLPHDGSEYAGRINAPDNAGVACGFQDSVTSLYFVTTTSPGLTGGLPNTIMVPSYNSSVLPGSVWDTVICHFPSGGMDLHAPAGLSGYTWVNGSLQSTIHITAEGTYWVKYKSNNCAFRTDTFRIKGNLPQPVITFANNILSVNNTYNSYQWYKAGTIIPGATAQNCLANGNGWYSVRVANSFGCTDSVAYEVTGWTDIRDNEGLKQHIVIYPNPSDSKIRIKSPLPVNIALYDISGKLIRSDQDTLEMDVRGIAEGLYLLRIMDHKNQLIKVEKLSIQHRR
jgi:hypothetical protein